MDPSELLFVRSFDSFNPVMPILSPNQDALFLPDMIENAKENVIRISLHEHQTLVIPTGWIHAVYTPIDSVVLGGNFLHGLDMDLQGKDT